MFWHTSISFFKTGKSTCDATAVLLGNFVMLLLYYLGILSTCDAAAVPREALEFAGMSINFRSGKFGYFICPIFSKGHVEIFREF